MFILAACFTYERTSSLIFLIASILIKPKAFVVKLYGCISIILVLTPIFGAFSKSTAKKPVSSTSNAGIPAAKPSINLDSQYVLFPLLTLCTYQVEIE